MRTGFLAGVIVLLGSAPVWTQTSATGDLAAAMQLWRDDRIDSLERVLPALVRRFPGKSETLFLQNLFERNGDKTRATYRALADQCAGQPVGEGSLFRLIQMEDALGRYQNAAAAVQQYRMQYPNSVWRRQVESLILGTDESAAATGDSVVSSPGRFTLQLGAFSQEKNAADLRERLVRQGYDQAAIKEKTVNGKKWFVVMWGSFDSRDDARAEGDKLKQKFQLNYTVTEP